MNLAAHIADRIRTTIEAGGLGKGIDKEAAGHGALALMGTIGAIWMLRPDGTLWDADADFGRPLTPLPPDLHVQALAYGAERYPWLAELLPPRPDESTDCEGCHGTGCVPMPAVRPDGRLLCRGCQGLGWVLNE